VTHLVQYLTLIISKLNLPFACKIRGSFEMRYIDTCMNVYSFEFGLHCIINIT